jgi:putative membrane protein
MYLIIKALHIIFVVTWFAGLFYIVRLLIYQREVHDKTEIEKDILLPQLRLMSRRLWYGITWPSAILTGIFGGLLLYQVPIYLSQPWMMLKLGLVVLLYGYHGYTHVLFQKSNAGLCPWSSQHLRIWNEVATLFLISIVFLVVLKSATNWVYFGCTLVVVIIGLTYAIGRYKKLRDS